MAPHLWSRCSCGRGHSGQGVLTATATPPPTPRPLTSLSTRFRLYSASFAASWRPRGGQWVASPPAALYPPPPDPRPASPHPAHPAAVIAQAPGGLCVELQLTLQLGCVLCGGGGGTGSGWGWLPRPPHAPLPETLPLRMPGPPCSSCALCHWLRCTMSWYCWATSGGTGRRACLRARIWGGAKQGIVMAPPQGPTEPPILPHRSRHPPSAPDALGQRPAR